MSGSGGSGTLNPPSDAENVAPVIPLRRREQPASPPAAGRTLPRERSAFDPELEPDPGPQSARPPHVAIAAGLRRAAIQALGGRALMIAGGLAVTAMAAVVVVVWASGGAQRHAPKLTAAATHLPARSVSADSGPRASNVDQALRALLATQADLHHRTPAAVHRRPHHVVKHRTAHATRLRSRHARTATSAFSSGTQQSTAQQSSTVAEPQQSTAAPQQTYSPRSSSSTAPPSVSRSPWGPGGTLGPGHSPDS